MPSLALLGRPILTADDGAIVTGRPAQRHCLALLSLLAVERRGLSRDRVIAYLWPEGDERAGRHRLSVTLHVLRQRLGGDTIGTWGDGLALEPWRWEVDAWRLEDAVARGDFGEAREVYGGTPLDGFYLRGAPAFEQWLEQWRDRVARRYLAVLDALALEAERGGDLEARVAWRQEIVARDPCSSTATLGLMRALAGAGRLEAALRSARAYTFAVREEFGLEPDPAVLDCARAFAHPRLPVPDPGAAPGFTG